MANGGTEDRNALVAAVNDSAKLVRTVFLTFLLVGTYILITIGSTTDVQLIKNEPVNLPILNVGLPLVGFFLLAPWLFVLLHFNLLLQYYLLARKAHRLQAAAGDINPDLLYPIPYLPMLMGGIGRRNRHTIFSLFVWLTSVVLPLVLLLWAQIRFLPFHDEMVTWFQRAAILVDLCLLWALWPPAMAETGQARDWWDLLRVGMKPRGIIRLSVATLACLFLSLCTATIPDESLDGWVQKVEFLTVERHQFSDGAGCPVTRCFWPTYFLFDVPGAWFHRNLRLAGAQLVRSAVTPKVLDHIRDDRVSVRRAARLTIVGLDLSNRDLRFADLRNAMLPNAFLQGSDLTGANLTGAVMDGADLRPFRVSLDKDCAGPDRDPIDMHARMAGRSIIPNARYCPTALVNTSMVLARLADAQMTGTVATGASFVAAEMQSATLSWAHLQHAVLQRAQLDGSVLSFSNFQDADLENAFLRNASIQNGLFNGASLRLAEINGADLRGSRLDGSNLEGAILRGTRLLYTSLNRANLRNADLHSADIRFAQMTGTQLANANLQLADLRGIERSTAAAVSAAPSKSDDPLELAGEPKKQDGFADAANLQGALCDFDLTINNANVCPNAYSDAYDASLLSPDGPLIKSACLSKDLQHVPHGALERVLSRLESDKQRQLLPQLAQRLLQDDCVDAGVFPPQTRADLENIARAASLGVASP